ncbi:MAG: hypothetical protein WCK47_01315 [bacterium]|nr:hypothetical protein [Candidatus Sumerlaeota bacterium]
MNFNRPLRRMMLIVLMTFMALCFAPCARAAAATALTAASQVQTTSAATLKALPPEQQPITGEMAARASLILVLFVVIASLIAMRRIPAMVALPLMALGIGLLAGIPLGGKSGILASILEGQTDPGLPPTGAFQLYKAIIYVLLGGMFARFISDARIAERIIKYAAEFGGEDPFFIALIMSALTALIFTAIGGLPAIIMLGTVLFPILLSLGVPAIVCGGMLMLSFPIGACLSPAGWVTRAAVFDAPVAEIRTFFLLWAGVQTMILLVFLSVEFLRMKRTTVTIGNVIRSISVILVAALILLAAGFAEGAKPYVSTDMAKTIDTFVHVRGDVWTVLQYLAGTVIVIGILHTQYQHWITGRVTTQWNMLTPILPLVFILMLGFGDAYGPAFLAAMAYGCLTTPRERGMQKLGKSIIDGFADVAAPAVLMLGIGMLIAAAKNPAVDHILTPILARVIPIHRWSYIIFFLLASPLALYRGPLNEFGLGAGIARLLSHFIPPPATMGAIISVGMLQDPTTTQNVWMCGYLKLDINALLFKLFFYSLTMCVIGLCVSAMMFMRG